MFLLQPGGKAGIGFADQGLVKQRLAHALLVAAAEDDGALGRIEGEGETPDLFAEPHPDFLHVAAMSSIVLRLSLQLFEEKFCIRLLDRLGLCWSVG